MAHRYIEGAKMLSNYQETCSEGFGSPPHDALCTFYARMQTESGYRSVMAFLTASRHSDLRYVARHVES